MGKTTVRTTSQQTVSPVVFANANGHSKERRPHDAPAGTIIDLDVATLSVDKQYQREPTTNLDRILAAFNEKLIGAIHVNRRADDSLWIIDGQHRWLACKAKGVATIPALIYTGLTVSEEAELFVNLNRTRAVTPWNTFKAEVLARSADQVTIERICSKRDQSILKGQFTAVRAAEWIFTGCGNRTTSGSEVLEWALDVHQAAWPAPARNNLPIVDGKVLKALAALYAEHGDLIDMEAMAKKIGRLPFQAIVTAARQIALVGVPLWGRVAFYLVDLYNRGEKRKSKHLPTWVATRKAAEEDSE